MILHECCVKKGVTESYSFQDQLWSHKWDFITHCIPSKFKYTNQIRLLHCYSQNSTQSSLNHKQIPVEFDLWLCLKFLKSLRRTSINYMVQRKKKIVKSSRTWQKLSISKHILAKKLEWYIGTPVCIYKLRDKATK